MVRRGNSVCGAEIRRNAEKQTSFKITKYIKPSLSAFAAFPAGKAPQMDKDKAKGGTIPKRIKLNANENPFGYSLRIKKALSDYDEYHLYPDPTQSELRQLLAEYVGKKPEHIIATAGADQLIDLVIRLFVDPGEEVITCIPSFNIVQFITRLCGGIPIELPRDENFAVEVESVKAAISNKTKVIYLCTPNNPTGNLIPKKDIIEILDTGLPVIVDEAYFEFSKETMVSLLDQYGNMIILRTLSKWASLAGFRISFGIASPEIAAHLMNIKLPFNIATPALIALRESLNDRKYLEDNVSKIIVLRDKLFEEFGKLSFLRPYPSHANFILCKVLRGRAYDIAQELERKGILVHCIDAPELRNCLRISVGLQEQNDELINVLSHVTGKGRKYA